MSPRCPKGQSALSLEPDGCIARVGSEQRKASEVSGVSSVSPDVHGNPLHRKPFASWSVHTSSAKVGWTISEDERLVVPWTVSDALG